MRKALVVGTWVFMVAALILFWISIRSTEDNLEYTLYALGTIVIAWLVNYLVKRYDKKEKED